MPRWITKRHSLTTECLRQSHEQRREKSGGRGVRTWQVIQKNGNEKHKKRNAQNWHILRVENFEPPIGSFSCQGKIARPSAVHSSASPIHHPAKHLHRAAFEEQCAASEKNKSPPRRNEQLPMMLQILSPENFTRRSSCIRATPKRSSAGFR